VERPGQREEDDVNGLKLQFHAVQTEHNTKEHNVSEVGSVSEMSCYSVFC
jgi:hypothetical protein